jgi:hypothetical protein
MDNELLAQILQELHEIKKDLRWFREQEQLRQRAVWEATNPNLSTEERAKALAAFVKKTQIM